MSQTQPTAEWVVPLSTVITEITGSYDLLPLSMEREDREWSQIAPASPGRESPRFKIHSVVSTKFVKLKNHMSIHCMLRTIA
jgi:hypothetical protein